MATASHSRDLSGIYGPESRSALYQWQRRLQTRVGNAVVLWMARRWQRLPADLGKRLGVGIGALMRTVSPRHARIVMTNLRLAFGDEKGEAELAEIARACYRHLGLCLTELIRLPAMSRDGLLQMVELRGKEHIEAALAAGRGAIILTGHLGNWELCGSRIAAEGYPMNVIARAQRDDEITEYIRRTREGMGMKVLHRGAAVRNALRALRNNQLLAVLLDQNAGDEGVFVDFFGHLASTAPGAAAFALKTGAAVLPGFCWRNPDDTHTAAISPPVPLVKTGDRDRDVLVNTARFTKIIEEHIRAHPEQWFWLHKRWKARPPEERARGAP